MDICSVLLFKIENLETWLVAEDNLVDDSLVIVLISEGDCVHICSVFVLEIEEFGNLIGSQR